MTPGATPDSPTARSSSSAIRTGRSGTSTRSRRDGPRSTVRSRSAAAIHTRCRQRSPPCTSTTRLTGSPVVELNRASALAEAGEVEAALALVDGLELDRYHYLHATRAELLRRLDRVEDAREAYDRALELVHSDVERRFLERRRAELEGADR